MNAHAATLEAAPAPAIQPRARTRRAVDLQPVSQQSPNVVPTVPEEIVSEVQEVIRLNKAANAATSAANKAKKALTKKLVASGVTDPFAVAFGESTYDVGIYAADKEVIDVEVLKGLVDEKTFMTIVKATKGETEKYGGAIVLAKATRTVKVEEDLHIKERK